VKTGLSEVLQALRAKCIMAYQGQHILLQARQFDEIKSHPPFPMIKGRGEGMVFYQRSVFVPGGVEEEKMEERR